MIDHMVKVHHRIRDQEVSSKIENLLLKQEMKKYEKDNPAKICQHSKETLAMKNADEKEKKLETELIENFKYFSI